MKVTILTFIIALLVSGGSAVEAQTSSNDLLALFPDRVAQFPRIGPPTTVSEDSTSIGPRFEVSSVAYYAGSNRDRIRVQITRFHQDAEAYSRLTLVPRETGIHAAEIGSEVGIVSIRTPRELFFVKGRTFVSVSSSATREARGDIKLEVARRVAEELNPGEGEIPVLIKHLPQWEQAQKTAVFLTHTNTVETLVGPQPVIGAVDTEGDADAVVASYGSSRLLLIEFNTPQLAAENDQRIIDRIHELWRQGLPAPSAYQRVGNYSVFVFDAADEQTAKRLIDQVKYEQVVQWLGENPYILQEAEKRYAETTLGVFVAVVKASGLALVGCFGMGGLFGALLFSHRRAQQRNIEAFSDAGGMLRLNIDDLTAPTDPRA